MFEEAFMQRAFLAAVLLGPLCALLGVFVTARRMAFFSDTVSHGALTGVALGFWLGLTEPMWPMIGFSLLLALLMVWLKERTDLLNDTIMALLLSGSVALGIVILSLLESHRGDLQRFLFGDITVLSWGDVAMAGFIFVAVVGGIFFWLSPLTLWTAQEEMAAVCGVRVKRMNYVFVLVLTLTVAMAIRLLGIMLVTSLLVIPPSAARNVSTSLRQQIWLSLVAGLISGVGGIVATYHLNVPCGPVITLVAVALFFLSLVLRKGRMEGRAA